MAVCLDGAAVIREAGVGVRGKAEPENEAATGFLTDCQLISGFFRNVSVLTAEARQAGRSPQQEPVFPSLGAFDRHFTPGRVQAQAIALASGGVPDGTALAVLAGDESVQGKRLAVEGNPAVFHAALYGAHQTAAVAARICGGRAGAGGGCGR